MDDPEILRASLEDPDQFEAVFVRHHHVIWRYLARRGGRGRADDLAGEVFVVAFATRDRYDPTLGAVRSWLYGIASNLLRTRFRSDGRQMQALQRAASREVSPSLSTDAIDERIAQEDRVVALLDAWPRLSESDREVITLFVWEELSYKEIAVALGIELGTVRSRLARARERLRELAGLSGELPDGVR